MKRLLTFSRTYLPRPLTAMFFASIAAALLIIGCDLLDSDDPIDFLANPLRRVFLGRLTWPAGETPFEVLAGDLNGDGLLDLVTLDWTTEAASVALADGAGGYREPVSYALGATPRAGVLADLTGNGILDLAVVNEEHAQVSLLFGDGAGAFDASQVIALAPGSGPRAIVAVDLNGDGITDLVTADTAAATITLLVGEGSGVFLEPLSIPVEHAPAGLWAGDLIGNGIVDIVAANPDANTLTLLEGTGIAYLPPRLLPCGYMPQLVKAADLNNNGVRDLIVVNAGSGDLSILIGLGEGQFSEEVRMAFPHPIGRFVVADLSGNMLPDIAALLFTDTGEARQPRNLFAVARNNSGGGFDSPAIYGSGWGALAITAADMNNSGRLDLVTADYSTNTVSIAYNRGNAVFEADRRFPVGSRPGAAMLADFNQNGRNDLAVLNFDSNSISLLAGQGNGAFEPLSTIMLPGKPLAMTAGDVNGDGRTDLVVTLTAHAQLLLYVNVGAGNFAPPQFFPILTDMTRGMPEARSVALGDMNNNGRLDIVTGNSRTDSVSVLLNNGTGGFDAPVVSAVGNYPGNVHLTDSNGNGNLDLVFMSTRDPSAPNDSADPRVIRWFGKGDGTFDFDTHARFATGSAPRMMAMADVTGNGRLDAITVHPENNSVYVLGGLSNGNFSQATRVYVGYRPIAAALADINRNGRADLAVVLDAGSVVVRFSRGELKFEDPNNFIASAGIVNNLVADLNGDGLMDMITINAAENDIGVLLGSQL